MQPMPRVPPFDRPATYDDLVKLPDIVVAEIVDGELHASPRPAARHIGAGSALGVLVGGPYQHGLSGPGGWWVLDEPELHLGSDVLVPDLAAWRRSRMPNLPDTACFPSGDHATHKTGPVCPCCTYTFGFPVCGTAVFLQPSTASRIAPAIPSREIKAGMARRLRILYSWAITY